MPSMSLTLEERERRILDRMTTTERANHERIVREILAAREAEQAAKKAEGSSNGLRFKVGDKVRLLSPDAKYFLDGEKMTIQSVDPGCVFNLPYKVGDDLNFLWLSESAIEPA